MFAPAALALAVALGAPVALQVDAGLHLEGRTRSADRFEQTEAVLVDTAATPSLTAEFLEGHGSLSIRYAPSLTLTNLGAGPGTERHVDVVHDGRVRYLYTPDATFRFGLTAAGEHGRTDLVYRALSTTTPIGTVPNTSPIDYQSGSAGFDLRLTPDRRTTWVLNGEISTDGGTTTSSQITLPVEDVVSGGLDYRWNATRLDDLGVSVAGRGSRFPVTGERVAYATALGGWHRRLATDDLIGGLAAGPSWLYSQGNPPAAGLAPPQQQRRILPAGEATLAAGLPMLPDQEAEEAVPGMLRAQLALRLEPAIDRLTTEVSQTLEMTAGLAWERPHGVSLAGRAGGAIAWQQLGRSEYGRLELRASWVSAPRIRPEVGLYVATQRAYGQIPSFTEYGVLVALTLDAPRQAW